MAAKRGRRGRGRKRGGGVTMKALHGHANKLRGKAPPPVKKSPWQTVTVTHTIPIATDALKITVRDIIVYLLHFKGLPAGQITALEEHVVIKVRRIDIYAIATASSPDRPSARLRCYTINNVFPSSTDPQVPPPLVDQIDTGNLGEAAKCSYTYPAAMQSIPLDAKSKLTVAEAVGNTANLSVRINLDWDFYNEESFGRFNSRNFQSMQL